MSDDSGAARFEASLLLLAGLTTSHRAQARPGDDLWTAILRAFRDADDLWVEYAAEPAAERFAELMASMSGAACWTHRHVAGIRRQYEIFVVDVDCAAADVVEWLRPDWLRAVRSLLDGEPAAEPLLQAWAAAVWRTALLTVPPAVSGQRLRLRARDPTSARLLVRAAQLLGEPCQSRVADRFRVVSVDSRSAAALTAMVCTTPSAAR